MTQSQGDPKRKRQGGPLRKREDTKTRKSTKPLSATEGQTPQTESQETVPASVAMEYRNTFLRI